MELSADTCERVTQSWDRLTAMKRYEETAGELIFERIFEMDPSSCKQFNFRENENLRTSDHFVTQAKRVVGMLECIVDILGPDLDHFTKALAMLGKRHNSFGLHESQIYMMEKAAIYALEELLDDEFSRSDRRAWQTVFYFVARHMKENRDEIIE